jgi:hypothetical protein
MTTSEKNYKSKKRVRDDDSPLSKNHSKSVKFRLRVQEEVEAEEEIKEYQDNEDYENYYKGN